MDFSHKAPFSAYKGNDPFIFTSYSHKDSHTVFQHIETLHHQGFRVWYDEGIDPGTEWPEEIAKAINKCACFIVFISPDAVASDNVRREINFAISRKKNIICIHIKETTLPVGLEMQLSTIQAILEYRIVQKNAYYEKLIQALPPETKGTCIPAKDVKTKRGKPVADPLSPGQAKRGVWRRLAWPLAAFALVMAGIALYATFYGLPDTSLFRSLKLSAATASPSPSAGAGVMRIAYITGGSQSEIAEAKAYAREKYGASVDAFNNPDEPNSSVIDQIIDEGYNMASIFLFPTQKDYVEGSINNALQKGIVLNVFGSPIGSTGIPVVDDSMSSAAFEMGQKAARKWKDAYPKKPIVVADGDLADLYAAADETSYKSSFLDGVRSVEPDAKYAGVLNRNDGNWIKQHAEVNILIVSGSESDIVLPYLEANGRGKAKDGMPLTEIICISNCSSDILNKVYDLSSPIKMVLIRQAKETARERIDLLFDIYNHRVNQVDTPAKKYKQNGSAVVVCSYWSTKRDEALTLYNNSDIIAP